MHDAASHYNRGGLHRKVLPWRISAVGVAARWPTVLDTEHPHGRIEYPGQCLLSFDLLEEPNIGIDLGDDVADPLEIRLAAGPAASIGFGHEMFDVAACDMKGFDIG